MTAIFVWPLTKKNYNKQQSEECLWPLNVTFRQECGFCDILSDKNHFTKSLTMMYGLHDKFPQSERVITEKVLFFLNHTLLLKFP